MTNTADQRRAATRYYATAATTINTMFDHTDQLRAIITTITNQPAGNNDPLRTALDITDTTHQPTTSIEQVRAAAVLGSEFRTRTELAADLGTRVSLLFPRQPTNVHVL